MNEPHDGATKEPPATVPESNGPMPPPKEESVHAVWTPLRGLKDRPVLFRGRTFHVMGFGVFAALSALGFGWVFQAVLLYRGVPADQVVALTLRFPMLAIMIWFFARLMNLLFIGRDMLRSPWDSLMSTGFNMHGGVVGLLLWGLWIGERLAIQPLLILDGLAVAAPFTYAIARLGCYNYGCCYGKPSSGRLAVRYTNPDSKILRVNPALAGVPVHPVQLYTSTASLVAFIVFVWGLRYAPPAGWPAGLGLLYFGGSRLVLERFRGDLYVNYDPTGQAIVLTKRLSFLLLGGGITLLAFVLLRARVTHPVAPPGIPAFVEQVRAYYATYGGIVIPLMVGSAALIFLGYGVHGKSIGTFPFRRGTAKGKPTYSTLAAPESSPYTITKCSGLADWLWVLTISVRNRQDCYFAVRQKIIIARRNGVRIGMLRVKRYRTFTEIGNAYIARRERGTGIIWALIEAVRVELDVKSDWNAPVYAIAHHDLAHALARYGCRPVKGPIPRPLAWRFKLSRLLGKWWGVDYQLIQLNALWRDEPGLII